MHGHHGHAVVAVHPAVQVGVQRDLIQEAGETRLRALGVFQVGQDAGAQLLHVLQPAPALHVVLLPQGGRVAASLADVIVELRQITLRQAAAHFLDHICKGFQLASCIFQLGEFLRTAEYVVERQAVLCGNNLGLVHGGLADLAGGNVDDAPQAQIIRGVVDDAQIGKHILDLGPVKKLQTTVDLIGDAAALAGVFQRVGLGVGTVQHRTVTPAAAPAVVHHDLPQDKVGLVALVEGGFYRYQLTAAVLRPQGLALAAMVVADDCVCRVQNVLRGAIILFQPNDPRPLELPFKAEDIGDIRTPEAVNALVIVTHHADVPGRSCQQLGQLVLQRVGVLILVYEDIAELPLVVLPHIRRRLQQAHRVPQQIIKVQRIGLTELFIVKCIYFTYPYFPPIVDRLPLFQEFLRRLHIVLGTGDGRLHLAGRKRLFLQPQLLEDVLDHTLAVIRVIDGKAAVETDAVDITPQDTHTGRVERGRPDIGGSLLPQHPPQAILQLVSSLVGEGDSQHLPGTGRFHRAEILHESVLRRVRHLGILLQKRYLVLADGNRYLLGITATTIPQQIGHPVDQHGRLTGASARQQKQRPLRGQHALALAVVQILIIHRDRIAPGLDKAFFQIRHRGASSFSFVALILIQLPRPVNRK